MRPEATLSTVWPRFARRRLCGLCAALAACCFCGAVGWCAGPQAPQGTGAADVWRDVAKIVERHLSADPQYQAGDLISQRHVEPIFEELLTLGFQPANHEELYDAVLPEQDRLVQLFDTAAGRRFMRQVARLPLAYDRLERMTWTDVGRRLIEELLVAEDGPKRFAAINSTDGLRKLQALVEKDPRGRNLALPTGNIHTAEDLVRQLREAKFVPKRPATK